MKTVYYFLILGQSFSRDKIKSRLNSHSKVILEHIAKCVLYGKNHRDYNSWIDTELAGWISLLGSLKSKNNKKLKRQDYEDTLFGDLGTTKEDAKYNLEIENLDNQKKKPPFPAVKITDDLVSKMFLACKEIKESMIDLILNSKDEVSKDEAKSKLHSILDKYC
jgi:hypothetical protein